ncbi:MAG TPA: hypothetical protein PKA64_23015 [Myxococcota bacterium]|nr:hypothetical protein [Myxococcota bacterium]
MRELRWMMVLSTLAACHGRPDREDPIECSKLSDQPDACPGGTDDEGNLPVPNNCNTLTHVFSASSTGYVERAFDGFGEYEYRSDAGQITTIYLTVCPEGRPPATLAMSYFGVARLEQGDYNISRTAPIDGGFTFAYSDPSRSGELTCNDDPHGTVIIDSIDYEQASGSFEVDTRCMDDSLVGRIPRDASFSGTFSANNIGVE